MAITKINKVYGVGNALQSVFPIPIKSQRAPTLSDRKQAGTTWIDIPNDDGYVAGSTGGAGTVWIPMGGGTSTFANLTVTASYTQSAGTYAFAGTTYDINATDLISLDSSGGAISLDAVAASNFSVTGAGIDLTMASAAGRVIVNGEEAAANAITLLSAAGGMDVNTALQINVDSSQAAADAILITASNAAGGIDIDAGTGGIGFDSSGQIQIGSTSDSAGAIIIDVDAGTGESVQLSSQQGTATNAVGIVSIAGGVTIDGSGDVGGAITLVPATNSAAGLAVTLNALIGVVTLTGNTTASGAQEAFTITNDEVAATSGIMVSVSNVGVNDARMSMEQVKPAAGSFVVNTQNNGAAALNGDVIISWIVLS